MRLRLAMVRPENSTDSPISSANSSAAERELYGEQFSEAGGEQLLPTSGASPHASLIVTIITFLRQFYSVSRKGHLLLQDAAQRQVAVGGPLSGPMQRELLRRRLSRVLSTARRPHGTLVVFAARRPSVSARLDRLHLFEGEVRDVLACVIVVRWLIVNCSTTTLN